MFEQRQNPIEAGSLFILTSGEYSDYAVNGVYRALVRIEDPDEEMKPFWEVITPNPMWGGHPYRTFHQSALIVHLLTSGMVEEVPHTDWWTP